MFDKFSFHLQDKFPEIGDKKILLAFSGGVDSMVLLDLLSKMNISLSLAHCNFKLRGKHADDDEIFVISQAEKYMKPLHRIEFDTSSYAIKHKCSIQMAARDLRYKWFKELMTQEGYDFLMTAHHADDNIETFFINLIRGTGIDGLIGIPNKSNQILRPLLPFGKKEIYDYAKSHQLQWKEDLSNQDDKYARNKIRMELVPLLKDMNPGFLDTFATTINNLKGSKEIISEHMSKVKASIIEQDKDPNTSVLKFKVNDLRKLSNNSSYLYHLFYSYGFQQWDDIRSLLLSQTGKQVFSKTHRLLKDRDYLILSEIPQKNSGQFVGQIHNENTSFHLEDISLITETFSKATTTFNFDQGLRIALFDKDLLSFPLTVRKWEKGDYFYPIGMSGKKKLSKYFKDEKYSLLEKENIWLLCSGPDIIWIIGKRIDDRFKVSDKTRTILKATLIA